MAATGRGELLTYSQAHARAPWLNVDNEFVVTGYRVPGITCSRALRSLFECHNETANVFTHLLGFCVFAGLVAFAALGGHGAAAAPALSTPESAPIWPIIVFAASAAACMGSSAAFHLLHVVDKRAFELLSRADYVGIALLIAGSVFPPYVYSFWCEPLFRVLYLSLICALCLGCCVMGMLDRFGTKEYLWPRTLAFMGAGLANLIPMLHLAVAGRSMRHEDVRYVLRALGVMAVFYVGGAFIYGLRVPERWARGRFDWFGSHAIWHLLVLAACLTHYDAVLVHWRWRSRFMDCSSDLALL